MCRLLCGLILCLAAGLFPRNPHAQPAPHAMVLDAASGATIGVTAMKGDLDAIRGTLNIDAGSDASLVADPAAPPGNLLMVSDVGSRTGDSNVQISNSLIRGLATADITYQASGSFTGGISIWSGYANDTIAVASTRREIDANVRTITSLHTGLDNDNITVIDLRAGVACPMPLNGT